MNAFSYHTTPYRASLLNDTFVILSADPVMTVVFSAENFIIAACDMESNESGFRGNLHTEMREDGRNQGFKHARNRTHESNLGEAIHESFYFMGRLDVKLFDTDFDAIACLPVCCFLGGQLLQAVDSSR